MEGWAITGLFMSAVDAKHESAAHCVYPPSLTPPHDQSVKPYASQGLFICLLYSHVISSKYVTHTHTYTHPHS